MRGSMELFLGREGKADSKWEAEKEKEKIRLEVLVSLGKSGVKITK